MKSSYKISEAARMEAHGFLDACHQISLVIDQGIQGRPKKAALLQSTFKLGPDVGRPCVNIDFKVVLDGPPAYFGHFIGDRFTARIYFKGVMLVIYFEETEYRVTPNGIDDFVRRLFAFVLGQKPVAQLT